MLAYSLTSSGLFPRLLWVLLLLAASLDAYKDSWDSLNCTEHEVSVDRGGRVVMACNILNNLREVSINLTAYEETRTIFREIHPGNYSKDSWQLQIQGGRAQLMITDVQGFHAGEYVWRLRGFQTNLTVFILNVNGLATDNQEPEILLVHAESPTSVRTEVIFVTIIIITAIITGISVLAWYKRRYSPNLHKYKFQYMSHGSPGSLYLTLP